MNLQNAARYIIILWLPLASLEIADESIRERLPSFKIQNGVLNGGNAGERNVSENRNGINGASHVSTNRETSANLNAEDWGETRKEEGKAHGQIVNLTRVLSALHDISNVDSGGSKSAVVVSSERTENRTRLRELRGWLRKRRRRKKRGVWKGGRKDQERLAAHHRSAFVADEEYEDEEDGRDDNEEINLDVDNEDIEEGNSTDLGRYLGSPCKAKCSEKLVHVFCEPYNRICECEKKYPVQIGIGRGCAKPKQLGDQCFYAQTCSFSDPNAICMQINHNAICQCKPGFHSVALRRGAKRSFCSEDQVVVSTDLATLLGVASGIAVLTGLICFVLKLFNSNRYPDRRRYNNANMAPPLLFSSDNQWINGIPLTVHGRPSSRTSSQRSTTNLAQYPRSKGVLVPASRAGAARAAAILLIPCHLQASKPSDTDVASRSRNDDSDAQENDKEYFSRPGSRRPSISSIKSTTSSQKSMSYSARRFEQENQQKEQRAAMRAAREEAARHAAPPTPSPLSTDELLPSCGKNAEDDPLAFGSEVVKSASPKSGTVSDLNAKLSPNGSNMQRL